MDGGTGYEDSQQKCWLSSYPRGESNAYRRNRNPKFYPLNYRGMPAGVPLGNANILNFCKFAV